MFGWFSARKAQKAAQEAQAAADRAEAREARKAQWAQENAAHQQRMADAETFGKTLAEAVYRVYRES